MANRTPVAIFMAASALLAASTLQATFTKAAENEADGLGGLKEWNTDQAVDDEAVPDQAAKEQEEKGKELGICIPIGEGENCW